MTINILTIQGMKVQNFYLSDLQKERHMNEGIVQKIISDWLI